MSPVATSYEWAYWGAALMIGFPLLVITLGEIANALERSGRVAYRRPVDLVRNSCLFLLFLLLLLYEVAEFDAEHIAVKVVSTGFWITVLNAAVVAFNTLIFDKNATDWRANAPQLLIDLARLLMVAFGAAFVIHSVWRVDLSGLLAALGVGSLVIGLALQETLGNVFSGIAMISARQFKVGDWVRVGDVEGQVASIDWRSVSVTTVIGDQVVIPNGLIAKERLRVVGGANGQFFRVVADVRVSYEHAPETVQGVVLRAIAATTGVLDTPKFSVRMSSLDEGAMVYTAVFAVRTYREMYGAKCEFLTNFWYAAEREGVVLPARYNTVNQVPAATRRSRDIAPEAIAARLSALDTFQRPLATLLEISGRARIDLFRKGEVLLAPGQLGKVAYVISSGSALVERNSDAGRTALDTLDAGELILFKAFFRGGGAPFTVRAESDLEVIAIPINDLEAALARDPELASSVERAMSLQEEIVKRVDGQLVEQSTKPIDGDGRIEILRQMFRV